MLGLFRLCRAVAGLCRTSIPGYQKRQIRRLAPPWALTEYDEEGEAVIHGYCDGSETEVLFELQNLTEVGTSGFHAPALNVGEISVTQITWPADPTLEPRIAESQLITAFSGWLAPILNERSTVIPHAS